MPATIMKIEQGHFGLTLVEPVVTDVCTATLVAFPPGFSCQITDGALNASPNVTTETVPATWCQPEQTVPQVGETSYTLDLTFLQDPQIAAGLSRFLFENDASEAWFFVGLDEDNPPKAIGKVRLVAGTFGGPARTTLTATVSLPVVGKPSICFGDSTTSAPIEPAVPEAMTAMTTRTTTKAKASAGAAS